MIPQEIAVKLKSLTEVKLYCYIFDNQLQGFWEYNHIEQIAINDSYLLTNQQVKLALNSLVTNGILLRVKKGFYKLNN